MSSATEAWFDSLPERWRDRAQRIREILLEASPHMREEWRYRSNPFYYHRTWMCYLALQQGALVLGFIQGRDLLDPEGLLERTDHKLIRHYKPPAPPERLDERALHRLINEAVVVNDACAPKRTGRRL